MIHNNVQLPVIPSHYDTPTKEESPRAIFALLDCIYRLSLILGSLKLDSTLSRMSTVDKTKDYTTNESFSYGLQSAASIIKVVAMIAIGPKSQPIVQALGEIPQQLLQGHLNSSTSGRNLLDKAISEDTKSISSVEQMEHSLKELAQRMIQTASAG